MWWGTRERIWETQNNYKSEKNDVEVIIMICELFFIHLQLPVYWQQEMLKRAGVYDQWWSMKIDHTVPSCNSCSISIFQKISCQPSSMDHLGKPTPSKMDEFSEKFQTAVDPPPSFSENHVADFFPKVMTEVPFIMAKICNINFWIGKDPPSPFRNFSENSSVLEG